jgi:predicted small secreted protein
VAEIKETLKVKDFAEMVKEITGLVKDSYLNGIEFAVSLWEENLKVLNSQVDQWLDVQQEYIKAGKEFYERFPKEVVVFSDGKSVDRFLAFQKDYIESIRRVSDKFIKETWSLAEKNVEKAFSFVEDYLSLLRA